MDLFLWLRYDPGYFAAPQNLDLEKSIAKFNINRHLTRRSVKILFQAVDLWRIPASRALRCNAFKQITYSTCGVCTHGLWEATF